MLIFVELLQVDERVPVLRIEPDDLLKRLERPVDEAAVLVVQAQAQQDMGMFDRSEVRTLQQPLVDGDRPPDLSFLRYRLPRIIWISSASLSVLVARVNSSTA